MRNSKATHIVVLCAISVLVFINLSSCNKFLDKKQNLKQTTPETLMDLQAIMDDPGKINLGITPSMGESASDDNYLPEINYNNNNKDHQNNYQWKYDDYSGYNDWLQSYSAIYNSNLVLELLQKIDQNSSNSQEWNLVKGTALFIRSYHYLLLLWNYAKAYNKETSSNDLGIVLRTSTDFNTKSLRASNEECYQRIITETKEAIALLPTTPKHVMRPSKAAAYGLLARCYLSMRNYKGAEIYADSCLKIKSDLMDFNSDPDVNAGLTMPFKIFNKETIFYTEMNTVNSLYLTYSYARIDSNLYYSYIPSDLRKTFFFNTYPDSTIQFTGSYSGTKNNFSGIATDEIILIAAESKIRNANIEDGLLLLNDLLGKRFKTGSYIPFRNLTQDDALNTVETERRKELVQRGLRWMDVKRLNVEGKNIIITRSENGQTFTLKPNANTYALPLPKDLILLTGIQQNPE